jgi:dihydrofolate reductase
MRKLIVTTMMSLDGVVGAPQHLLPAWDAENKAHAVAELADCDAFLFGRLTFEAFAARWPSVRGDAFADALNERPKYVASRTLMVPPAWRGTRVLAGDVARAVDQLKRESGTSIVKYGVGPLDGVLLAHGLVDELRVSIVPVALGAGRRLFEGFEPPRLELAGEKRFANGIVRLSYEVQR